MFRSLFLVVLGVSVMLRPLRAETERFELRYVEAAEVLEMWVRGNGGVRKDGEIEAIVKAGEATINGVKVVVDPRLNHAVIEGNALAVAGMRRLVKEIDVRPAQVRVSAALLEVEVGEGLKTAFELFDEKAAAGALVFEEDEAGLDGLVEKALATMRAEVRSRPQVVTASNKEATLSTGTVGGEVYTLKITPLVHSADEITLRMDSTLEKGGAIQQLNTTVRLPGGATVAVGGMVVEDADGRKRELLLLVQPTVIEGEKAE